MKFGQLTLGKIIKIVDTRCQILRLKCTKFNFGPGLAYSAPPDPLAGLRGPTSKGREGEGRGRGGKERGGGGGKRGVGGRGLQLKKILILRPGEETV